MGNHTLREYPYNVYEFNNFNFRIKECSFWMNYSIYIIHYDRFGFDLDRDAIQLYAAPLFRPRIEVKWIGRDI